MSVMAGTSPGETRQPMGWPRQFTVWHGLLIACGLLFAWATAQFYSPTTGFSSLIMIGDSLNEKKVTALKQVRHYVYDESYGYDGAYYVQLALYPTLENPELADGAIDNLPYRARRMLFSWVAWALGLGQPAWVIQAHALLNVGCWFILGFLLLRWFPPTDGQNFFRWAGIMFCQGVCMSIRHSLVDLPALLLVVWAVRLTEQQNKIGGSLVLALVGLGKETNLLAATSLADESTWRAPRGWFRLAARCALIALPLAIWMTYVRLKFGAAGDAGFNNFTWPFAGVIEKWGFAWRDWWTHPSAALQLGTLAALIGVTVQFGFIVSRWWPQQIWWRVGAAFAALMIVVSQPVWEGYPGAFGRVLLPMGVAFNNLVPRGRRWWPLLVAGNLSLLAAWQEFSPPPAEFLRMRGAKETISRIEITPQKGWHGPENGAQGNRWRWTSGEATLVAHNPSNHALTANWQGQVSAIDPQNAQILVGSDVVWRGEPQSHPVDFAFTCTLPPGDTSIRFRGDKPARRIATDPRMMALCVFNVEVTITPKGGEP